MRRIYPWFGTAVLIGIGVSLWRDVIPQRPESVSKARAARQPDDSSLVLPNASFLKGNGSAAWAGQAPKTTGKMQAGLNEARSRKKHLFALFIRAGDGDCDKMKGVFKDAEPSLKSRAVFRVATVSDPSEAEFVAHYEIDRAPLPLTLVFAPNGAIVRAFAGKVVAKADLSAAFASPAFAQVMKEMQAGKLVLLCVQGKQTQHNAESLAAARAAAADKRSDGAVVVVTAAPEDSANTDVLKPLKADATLKDATVFILTPPSTLAGKGVGATSKEAVWDAIVKCASACSSGSCGSGGCGTK